MPEDETAAPGLMPVWETAVQRRGTVTLPGPMRTRWGVGDGARLLWTPCGPDTMRVGVLEPPAPWFARWDGQVDPAVAATMPDDRLPTRWLTADAVLGAQAHPAGALRRWFGEADAGFQQARVDPVMLADWLDRLPRLLPGISRADIARYALVVLHWRGITLTDRAFYAAALLAWGTTDAPWPVWVQAAREAWTAEEAEHP